ncbi:GNAT family N-acetyltransferase [Dactylosporangium sp. NPDC049140]|jgi:predicted acetyltransferase|uniref:GNAT family N-acetyltransferase n=1 Tax=Dactylosporangium sp. NPDC049140 TaxID=3155647 RepID=UPI0033CF1656
MSDYVLRTATEADLEAIARVRREAFGATGEYKPEGTYRSVFEAGRTHVAEQDGQVVAVAGAFTRDLAVPGAVIPAAHVTGVSVSAVHTRQGLLSRLMAAQLTAAPEAVAVLWASEGRIYPRFGYGLAAQNVTMRADRRDLKVTARPAPGTLRSGNPAELVKELSEVYSRVLPGKPGWSSRDETWWRHLTADPERERGGGTKARAVLYENADGVVEGFARFRIGPGWDDNGPKQEVNVIEVVAGTPAAYAEIYRFLLRIDLARTLVQGCTSADDPLFHLVDEPRQLGAKAGDGLWLRIIDVPRALTARRYAAPLDVVFEVTDALVPGNAGRWRLRAGAGGALVTCTPADGEPDFTLGITELGAAYLGGTRLGALHLAGRIDERRPGAVAAASTAFGWPVAPYSIEIF